MSSRQAPRDDEVIETTSAARVRERAHIRAHWTRAAAPVFVVLGLIVAALVAATTKGPAPAPGLPVPTQAGTASRWTGLREVRPLGAPPAHDRTAWTPIGRSVQGRPILLAEFGSGPRRILIIGGVHGNEFGTDVAERFAEYLRAEPSALPAGAAIDIVACLNPDGRARSTRSNARGVDLNRNLPASTWAPLVRRGCTAGPRAGSEPETMALLVLLGRGYSRVITLHSAGGLIDYDGPGGRQLAGRISAAWHMPLVHLASQHDYSGTLGQYVPERYGVPVITVELLHPRLSPNALAGLSAAIR